MRLAIEVAKNSVAEDDRKPHPKVGAVVVRDGKVLDTAYRSDERGPGDHAEYVLLKKKLRGKHLSKAILYTTLEPCTVSRTPPKRACWRWIVERGIHKVVIGILDPNPHICGKGEWILKSHGVVVDRFPPELQAEIEKDNSEFTRKQQQALFKEVVPRLEYQDLTVPCPYCGRIKKYRVRLSEEIHHTPTICSNSKCRGKFLLHSKGRGFYTTYRAESGKEVYGVSPAMGFSFVDAIRWALESSQGWIEPVNIRKILSLMEETEKNLRKKSREITPKQIMNAMLESQRIPAYRVSRERVRSFLRFVVKARYFPYFTYEKPGSRWNTPYTNEFHKERAIQSYVESYLYVLRRKRVVQNIEQAINASNFLLKEIKGIDGSRLARTIWETRFT